MIYEKFEKPFSYATNDMLHKPSRIKRHFFSIRYLKVRQNKRIFGKIFIHIVKVPCKTKFKKADITRNRVRNVLASLRLTNFQINYISPSKRKQKKRFQNISDRRHKKFMRS